MRLLELRFAGRIQIASTVVVVACTLVTTWLLVRTPETVVVLVDHAPRRIAYLPAGPWAVRATTACPATREAAQPYNTHTWVDPWGVRGSLTCGEQAIVRMPGLDKIEGTADDLCYEAATASCTLVPSSTDGG
ncbi:MAG: hypothetical protein WKG01_27865 [Kofleriaceae bacterium]